MGSFAGTFGTAGTFVDPAAGMPGVAGLAAGGVATGGFAAGGMTGDAGKWGEGGEGGESVGGASDGECLSCNPAFSQSSLDICRASKSLWLALQACLCGAGAGSCDVECAAHSLCSGVDGGGFTPACGECLRAHCWTEEQACEGDY